MLDDKREVLSVCRTLCLPSWDDQAVPDLGTKCIVPPKINFFLTTPKINVVLLPKLPGASFIEYYSSTKT